VGGGLSLKPGNPLSDIRLSCCDFWHRTCAVAEALLEREALSGRAVLRIIKSSLEIQPSPWADLPD
jgi:hypothetical protein